MGAGISGPKSVVQSSIDAAKNSTVLDFFGIECSNLRLSFDSYTWPEELKRKCQTIRFQYCHSFPNFKVIYSATGSVARIESVRYVQFEECSNLTSSFLEYLFTSCPNLQELSIINSSGISYLPSMISKFNSLRKITLVNIPTLQTLPPLPPTVSHLTIIDCPIVKIDGNTPQNTRIINTDLTELKALKAGSRVELIGNSKLETVDFPATLISLSTYDNLKDFSDYEHAETLISVSPRQQFSNEANMIISRADKTDPLDSYTLPSFWTPTVSRNNALYCRTILPFFYGAYNITESQYNYKSDTMDPCMFPILSSLCTNLKTRPAIEHSFKHIHASFGFSTPVRYCAKNYIDNEKPYYLLWALRVALIPDINNHIIDETLDYFGRKPEIDKMSFRTLCYLIHGSLSCHPIQDFDELLSNSAKLATQSMEDADFFLKLLNLRASTKKAYDISSPMILLYIINALRQRESISANLAYPSVTKPLYCLLNTALNGLSNESFESMKAIKSMTHVYNTLQICSFVF